MFEILIYAAIVVMIATGGMSIYADVQKARVYKKFEQTLNGEEHADER